MAFHNSFSSTSSSPSTSQSQYPLNLQWHSKLLKNNNQIDETILPINPSNKQHSSSSLFFISSSSQESSLPIIDSATNNNNNNEYDQQQKLFSSLAQNKAKIMWPYQSYKPISWDKYYAHDLQDKHVSITSGLAAGITIGVFFAVFLLTFGCRLYSQRSSDSRNRSQNSSPRRRLSVSDLLGWPSPTTVCRPPPPYEIAIQMPAPCSTTTLNTLVSTPCEPPAPTYEDSFRHSCSPNQSRSPSRTSESLSNNQRIQSPTPPTPAGIIHLPM